MKRADVVEQIRKIIHEIAPTAKAILFGSEARGEARSDSDIDLLILVERRKNVSRTGRIYYSTSL